MDPARIAGPGIGRIRAVIVALICWAVISLLYVLHAFEPADLNLLDWRYRIRGERTASDSIAIVEVDDATIEAYGDWPLPRDQYALLIAALEEAGASVVGMDLLFLGNDKYDPRFDALLALMAGSYENVVNAIAFSPEPAGFEEGINDGQEYTEILEQHGFRNADVRAFGASRVTLPFDDLLRSSKSIGHVVVMVDRDGVVRRVPTFVRYRGVLYPCFGVSVTALKRGGLAGSRCEPRSGGVSIGWKGGDWEFVPISSDGSTRLDFAGDRSAFRHIHSMLEVLQWYAAGDSVRLAEAFRNRIVLVGATAVGQIAADLGATPFSIATPLVFVHANAVNSFLTGRFLARPSSLLYMALLGVLSIGLGWSLPVIRISQAILVIGSCLAGILGLTYLLFLRGIEVPPTAGLALPPLIYAALQSYRFVFVERKVRERQIELRVASSVQRKLLPDKPLDVAGLQVFGTNIPALEVGGDYYDWIAMGDGSVAVAVGDVCGKGLPAAILMAHLEASFHAEVKEGVAPGEILKAMNRSLNRSVESDRFATFVLALVPASGDRLLICNAGHNPAIIAHKGGIETSTARGLALGIFGDTEYEEESRSWSIGDVLILYSDGVTECTWGDRMYEEERLHGLVTKLPIAKLSADEIGKAILDDVRAFSHGHLESDDVTLVVIKHVA